MNVHLTDDTTASILLMIKCHVSATYSSDWNCKSHDYTYLINDKMWHVGQIFIRLKLPQNHSSGAIKQMGRWTFARLKANLMTTEIGLAIPGGLPNLLRHTTSQTSSRNPAGLGNNNVTLWSSPSSNAVLQNWNRTRSRANVQSMDTPIPNQ